MEAILEGKKRVKKRPAFYMLQERPTAFKRGKKIKLRRENYNEATTNLKEKSKNDLRGSRKEKESNRLQQLTHWKKTEDH